jgi:hypothetical protein
LNSTASADEDDGKNVPGELDLSAQSDPPNEEAIRKLLETSDSEEEPDQLNHSRVHVGKEESPETSN